MRSFVQAFIEPGRLQLLLKRRPLKHLWAPILCLYLVSGLWGARVQAQQNANFLDMQIQKSFQKLLVQDPEFMKDGGARLLKDKSGRVALVGIAKVVAKNKKPETLQKSRRTGQIMARAAALELLNGVQISTSRGLREGASLSSSYQITEARVAGRIQQLPVIGTWWSPNRNILYVAVGEFLSPLKGPSNPVHGSPLSGDLASNNEKAGSLPDMEGQEPFLSLLRITPVLCRNGGVRGFYVGRNKVLISVASSSIKGSRARSQRIAQLKAIRSLLGHRKGIQLSSVQYLGDQEELRLTEGGVRHALLSQFLSIQDEQVEGYVKSLPIVATWEEPKVQVLYVAIGKLWH